MPNTRWLLAVALVSFLSGAASAAEDHWEFGFDQGQAYPLRNNTFSHDVPNATILQVIGPQNLPTQVAAGYAAPNFGFNSTVSGTLEPMTDTGMHLYYRVTPELQFGVEGGFEYTRSLFIDQRGAFAGPFTDVSYRSNILHVTPMAKWGRWWKSLRPVFGLGPGWYRVRETLSIGFTGFNSLNVVDRTLEFSGLAASAGVDYKIAAHGIASLSCQYDKVFGDGNKLDFLLPRASLSVFFGGDEWY